MCAEGIGNNSLDFSKYLLNNEQYLNDDGEKDGVLTDEEISVFYSGAHLEINSENGDDGKIEDAEFDKWYEANKNAISSFLSESSMDYNTVEAKEAMKQAVIDFAEKHSDAITNEDGEQANLDLSELEQAADYSDYEDLTVAAMKDKNKSAAISNLEKAFSDDSSLTDVEKLSLYTLISTELDETDLEEEQKDRYDTITEELFSSANVSATLSTLEDSMSNGTLPVDDQVKMYRVVSDKLADENIVNELSAEDKELYDNITTNILNTITQEVGNSDIGSVYNNTQLLIDVIDEIGTNNPEYFENMSDDKKESLKTALDIAYAQLTGPEMSPNSSNVIEKLASLADIYNKYGLSQPVNPGEVFNNGISEEVLSDENYIALSNKVDGMVSVLDDQGNIDPEFENAWHDIKFEMYDNLEALLTDENISSADKVKVMNEISTKLGSKGQEVVFGALVGCGEDGSFRNNSDIVVNMFNEFTEDSYSATDVIEFAQMFEESTGYSLRDFVDVQVTENSDAAKNFVNSFIEIYSSATSEEKSQLYNLIKKDDGVGGANVLQGLLSGADETQAFTGIFELYTDLDAEKLKSQIDSGRLTILEYKRDYYEGDEDPTKKTEENRKDSIYDILNDYPESLSAQEAAYLLQRLGTSDQLSEAFRSLSNGNQEKLFEKLFQIMNQV